MVNLDILNLKKLGKYEIIKRKRSGHKNSYGSKYGTYKRQPPPEMRYITGFIALHASKRQYSLWLIISGENCLQ